MAKVTLTMMQRLNLDALLGIQRGGMEDLFVLHDIREKIKVPRALREEYLKVLPDGRVLVDERAVELAEPGEYDLDKEESRRLLRLFKEWREFAEGDVMWVAPLRKQLEAL